MNPQVPDELISAYFDGEVTPEERAAVERLLAESDESQRELNETARLSALLHSFPRESAPIGLSANVLQQTNLLPMPTVPQAPAPAAMRSSGGEWRAALISSVVTAAALLMVAWGLGHFDDHQAPAVASNSSATTLSALQGPLPAAPTGESSDGSSPVASTSVALEDRALHLTEQQLAESPTNAPVDAADSALKQVATKDAGNAPMAKSAPRAAHNSQRYASDKSGNKSDDESLRDKPAMAGAQMPSLMAAQAVAPMKEKEQGADADSLQIGNYSNLLSNQAFLDKLQVGEMYTFVPQVADPENTVGVVDLEVVDIDRGTETIQVLLRKNEIQPRSVDDAKEVPQKKLQRSGDDLVVVYAVAPGERLVQALNDVNQHPDLFRGWSSQVPLQVSDNDVEADGARKGAETLREKSEVGRSRNSVAMRRGAVDDKETADAQRALATLVARGASVQLNNSTNAAAGPGVVSGGRGAADSLPAPAVANSRLNNDAVEMKRNDVAQRQNFSGKGDYEVMRVPVSNPVAQLNPLSRSMQQNTLDYRRNAVAMGTQANEKASQRIDSNNTRAVRMLFVLHPAAQTDASQAAPAPAATKAGQ